MDKHTLKSAMRRELKKSNPLGLPESTQVEQMPQRDWESISMTDVIKPMVVSEEDWESLQLEADKIMPDRTDLVWIRDDKGELLGAMVNDPELMEIYKNANIK